MEKFKTSLHGFWLFMTCAKIFNPIDFFSNKRVAIVGPADSAYERENGDYIDAFDYIIRINKAPSSWIRENEKFTGTRTDIWYHSFFENEESGGGPLSPELLKERGI